MLFLTQDEPDTALESVCIIKYGKPFEASKLAYDMPYPVYGGNGIIGTVGSYMFDDMKISISCRGAASGNLYLTKPKSSISSNSLYLDDIEPNKLLPLFYYLKSADIKSFCTGSAQPQITIENIRTLKIPSSIFEISHNNAFIKLYFKNAERIEKLERTKQLLLRKYF